MVKLSRTKPMAEMLTAFLSDSRCKDVVARAVADSESAAPRLLGLQQGVSGVREESEHPVPDDE